MKILHLEEKLKKMEERNAELEKDKAGMDGVIKYQQYH